MSNLRRKEMAAEACAMGRPQPFPLTGDGAAMAHIWNRQSFQVLCDRERLAAAIAEARYRDWLASRERRR